MLSHPGCHDKWLPLLARRDVCAITKDAWDMQDKTVGTVGAGHIGRAVMERLAVSKESAAAQASSAAQPGQRHAQAVGTWSAVVP